MLRGGCKGVWIGIALLLVLLLAVACTGRNQITPKDRTAAQNYFRLAISNYEAGQVIEALRNLQEAEKFNPEDKHVKHLFGIIYLGKNKFPEAEANLKEAVRLDPEFSDAYNTLAAVYMAQEKWPQAVEALDFPANDLMYPQKAAAFNNLGWCHYKLGNPQKALEYFRSATVENPKFCLAFYNTGIIYKSLAKYTEAIRFFDQAINATEECNNYFQAIFELAQVAIKARDFEKARPALEKCVRLGGSSNEARICRDNLRMIVKPAN